MDIIKQKRLTMTVIIILILLNLTILTLLWLGRPTRLRTEAPPPALEKQRLQHLLRDELGFDQRQIEQFQYLQKMHRDQVRVLQDEIQQLKKQMFDAVLDDNPNPVLSDSLLQLSQDKQAEIERLTFQHFVDLKKLCSPEQQDKLQLLIHDMFRRPPQGERPLPPPPGESPLSPPEGERPRR